MAFRHHSRMAIRVDKGRREFEYSIAYSQNQQLVTVWDHVHMLLPSQNEDAISAPLLDA